MPTQLAGFILRAKDRNVTAKFYEELGLTNHAHQPEFMVLTWYNFYMEKWQPIDSDAYLRKVQKADFEISPDELEESIARLSEPFEHVNNSQEKVEISFDGAKIEIKYGPYVYKKNGQTYTANRGKVIDQFFIKTPEGGTDLLQFLPKDSKIIVYQESRDEYGHVMLPDEDNVRHIVIQGEINSPKMIAIVLHEIGHMIDYSKLEELGVDSLMDDKQQSDIAEEIRRERSASAFTLKALKPFLKDSIVRKDMINFLKFDALKSYYDHAKKKLGNVE